MKSNRDLKKSANACLNKIIKNAQRAESQANLLKSVFCRDAVKNMRENAEAILKYTHEYSAYSNAGEWKDGDYGNGN